MSVVIGSLFTQAGAQIHEGSDIQKQSPRPRAEFRRPPKAGANFRVGRQPFTTRMLIGYGATTFRWEFSSAPMTSTWFSEKRTAAFA
jgi:hypothetical protein